MIIDDNFTGAHALIGKSIDPVADRNQNGHNCPENSKQTGRGNDYKEANQTKNNPCQKSKYGLRFSGLHLNSF